MLALVTYSSLCVSMLALLLTVLVLSCLRGLKSNTRSIHSNTAAAMFLSELVFLLGVSQTEQQVNTGGGLCAWVSVALFVCDPLASLPSSVFFQIKSLSHQFQLVAWQTFSFNLKIVSFLASFCRFGGILTNSTA